MIKTSELRRNNLVEEEVLGYVTVNEIYENSVSVLAKHMNVDRSIENIGYAISSGNLSGIPLTPEILEACGFEHVNMAKMAGSEMWCYLIGSKCFRFRTDGFYLIDGDNRLKNLSGKMEYLHQLQNLYYSLTGEELQLMVKNNLL